MHALHEALQEAIAHTNALHQALQDTVQLPISQHNPHTYHQLRYWLIVQLPV